MVQVVENRSDVRGRVTAVAPHTALPQFVAVRLHVAAVTPVPGYPNLLGWAQGQEIAVNVATERVDELQLTPGDEVFARVRLGGPQAVFADPASVVRC